MRATGWSRSRVAGGLAHDGVRVAEVGVDVMGDALRGAGEQGAGVGQDQRVVVDVDDAALGGHALGDLMGVVHAGQAGADVQELPDALLIGQVTDGAGEEVAGGAGAGLDAGEDLAERVTGGAVHLVVVLAAQPVVPDPGGLRHGRVEPGERVRRGVGGLFGHGRSCACVRARRGPRNRRTPVVGNHVITQRFGSCASSAPTDHVTQGCWLVRRPW